MRLSELLDHDVIDDHGSHLGHVHEVRIVQDGPQRAGLDHALRLHGLYVGTGSIGRRLGYRRRVVRGPWLIRAVLGRGRVRYVPWTRVTSVGDIITISGDGRELSPIGEDE
jgi:sporulation protein YlmC with PRC-barrel domain